LIPSFPHCAWSPNHVGVCWGSAQILPLAKLLGLKELTTSQTLGYGGWSNGLNIGCFVHFIEKETEAQGIFSTNSMILKNTEKLLK
jgi:hypothetical protein